MPVGLARRLLRVASLHEAAFFQLKEEACAQSACRKGWLRTSPTGPVSPAAVLAVAADIASAMVALHGAGIVHRDLSGGAHCSAGIAWACVEHMPSGCVSHM